MTCTELGFFWGAVDFGGGEIFCSASLSAASLGLLGVGDCITTVTRGPDLTC